VIASACCWLWFFVVIVSIVSVFILQSIRRLVVVLDADDDEEDGGEWNTAIRTNNVSIHLNKKFIHVDDVGDWTFDVDVRILWRVLCCWFRFSFVVICIVLSRLFVKFASNDVNG
jgi:hypothetical protein